MFKLLGIFSFNISSILLTLNISIILINTF